MGNLSKDNMFYSSSKNLLDAVIDEIALEGLDGITLEALWQRLTNRLQISGTFPQLLKQQIWAICVSIKDFTFHQLDEPRSPLIIYDRYEFVDPDLGTIVEPDNLPDEIYEYSPVDDVQTGIKGSCKSYFTRKPIESVKCMSLDVAEKSYGATLVIVASQAARQHALFGDTVCPTLELNVMQFCFLERVGRSRYHGEVTQGKRSLSMLKEDPKSLFYHRKVLLKHKLMTKQMHYQRNSGHGTSGSLLHLPRFYVERKPKMIYLAEKIIEILKKRENNIADYVEIKKELGVESSLKHLFKTAFFQRVIRSEFYHRLSPKARSSEYSRNNCDLHEKKIRAVQLIDPSLDINDLWMKDDGMEDEESYELDTCNQKIHEPFLRQANSIVERANYNGLSQGELALKMGVTKLQARTIFRNLSKIELVATYMNDMGRQRITKYVSKKFEKNSSISMQFQTEMEKMKELTRRSSLENVNKIPSTTDEFFYPSIKSKMEEMNSKTLTNGKLIQDEKKRPQTNIKNSFSLVNKIIKKYKLNKCVFKYSITHLNIGEIDDLLTQLKKSCDKISNISQKHVKLLNLQCDEISRNQCKVALQETEMSNDSIGDIRCSIKDMSLSDPKNTGTVTYRILKRANMIIEAVKEHKVIDDTSKLMKMINEEEEREGYDVKIDKKSLIRLLQKLAIDNLLKNMKLTLSANGMKKILTFVCDPSINVNHTVIQSAVEQAKIKFCLMNSNKRKSSPRSNSNLTNVKIPTSKFSIKSSDENSKIIPTNLVINAKAGKDYGYSPKFIRMKVIHQLLYYLIYDHPGQSHLPRAQQIQEMRVRGHQLDDMIINEMGEIFSTQIGWKMFIPPLPNHNGWPKGWALFCDVLLRLPLSMFLKVYNVPFIIPDLDYYTKHLIRQHYLVKDLPAPLRNVLLMKRRYIFSVHETITRLCFIGLIQFGPQKLKEKDQVFLYLNRRSELMDTTTSAAGYHKIQDRNYPVTNYLFDKMQVVEKYWYDMWHICINTQLGGRLAVQGTDIILEELTKKIEMVQTLRPIVATEAALLDFGIMPGDKKGAAGIDSAFFSHLKRNWNWDNFNSSYNMSANDNEVYCHNPQRKTHRSTVQTKPIKFTEFTGLRKVIGPTPIEINDLKDMKKSNEKLSSVGDKLMRIKLIANNKDARKQNAIVRRVLPRKRKARRRVKYDDIDYSALQKMEKLRVDWNPREDNILLVCKVVMMYLAPNPRSQVITFTAVRDVLRSYSLSSYNKTSRACQRRLLYMLKQPQTIHSVALGVEEIKQNYFVNKKYGDVVAQIKRANDPNDCDEKMAVVFKNLVAYVAKKYYDISQTESKATRFKPNTVQEFNLIYEINHPQKPQINQGFTHDIKSINDIHTATINSVIYSSMCCGKDRKSWAYQLFRIYQQYPEILLRNAMGKIRSDQMVSIKRNYVSALKKYGNCMPMSSSQYQLSTSYIYKFQTKLPAEIYSEIQDYFSKIISGYVDKNLMDVKGNGVQVFQPTGGMIVAIQECLAQHKLKFNVEIPDHVITLLDPKLQEYDETYIRIAKRYKDILASLEQNHTKHEYLTNSGKIQAHLPADNKKNAEFELVTKPNVQNPKIEAECISASNKQQVKKSTIKREHWGWGLARFHHENDESIQEDGKNLYSDRSEDNIDCEYIQLQDGTLIKITKGDIEQSRSSVIDSNIHAAFFKTHTHLADDFIDCTSIKRLNEMVNNSSMMNQEIDAEECTVLRPEEPKKKIDNSEQKITVGEKHRNSNFINDIIANMECEIESISSCCQKNMNSEDVHKSCTRIALLKMREELNEDLPDSHHAHEYFVVSTFRIYYSLSEIDAERCRNPNVIVDGKITREILLLNEVNFNRVDSDLRKFTVFPKDFPDVLRIKMDLEQQENITGTDIDSIFDYVREKRERGATLKELKVKFYNKIGKRLYDILYHMMNRRLFLRSGVTEMHYIHHNFIDPWIIQSIRIMRLQREGLPTFPSGTVYVLNPQHSERIPSKNDAEDCTDIKKNGNSPPRSHENNSTKISNNQKTIRKNRRTCLLQTKDIYSAAKKLDLNTAEDIHVVIRPWIQIDGVINRSMLEKMLGAVLAHCVMNPGIVLNQVQSRFVPALQPYHTRELVEMLVNLGCLQFKVISKVAINLFSKSSSTRLKSPAKIDGSSASDYELIVEAEKGATLKFSTFLHQYQSKIKPLLADSTGFI